jgi:hypothetical protein
MTFTVTRRFGLTEMILADRERSTEWLFFPEWLAQKAPTISRTPQRPEAWVDRGSVG